MLRVKILNQKILKTVFTNLINSMRKRSGALHSQSQEEYIETTHNFQFDFHLKKIHFSPPNYHINQKLAQLSHNKTGIFYDQKILKNIIKQKNAKDSQAFRKSKQDKTESSSAFSDFDFNQQIEQMKEQLTEVSMESHQATGAITVIICQNTKRVKSLLLKHLSITSQMEVQEESDSQEKNRQIDLVMGKGSFQKLGIKYWIMSAQFSSNLIASSYIHKANALYFVQDQGIDPQQNQRLKKFANKKISNYSLRDDSLSSIVSHIIQDSLKV